MKTKQITLLKQAPLQSSKLAEKDYRQIPSETILSSEGLIKDGHIYDTKLKGWVYLGHVDVSHLELASILIKPFEGLRLAAYICPANVPTIGYGTTRINGQPIKMGLTITKEKAEELLINDIKSFEAGIVSKYPTYKSLSKYQQAAILSFAYNVGTGAFLSSTFAKRVAIKDPMSFEELRKWNKGGGKVLAGLTRRREAEIAMFKAD
jgi:lysozyme